MSKPQSKLSAVMAILFPSSFKAISEKLSADELNAFASDASKLTEEKPEAVTPPAAPATPEAVTPPAAPEAVASEAEPTADGLTSTDLQAKVNQLEAKVTTLEAEKATLIKEKATAEASVTELNAKLTANDEYVAKVKASINPLAEEDLSNSKGADAEVLTDTDRKARENKARFVASQE